jgi:hypothetical protein
MEPRARLRDGADEVCQFEKGAQDAEKEEDRLGFCDAGCALKNVATLENESPAAQPVNDRTLQSENFLRRLLRMLHSSRTDARNCNGAETTLDDDCQNQVFCCIGLREFFKERVLRERCIAVVGKDEPELHFYCADHRRIEGKCAEASRRKTTRRESTRRPAVSRLWKTFGGWLSACVGRGKRCAGRFGVALGRAAR